MNCAAQNSFPTSHDRSSNRRFALTRSVPVFVAQTIKALRTVEKLTMSDSDDTSKLTTCSCKIGSICRIIQLYVAMPCSSSPLIAIQRYCDLKSCPRDCLAKSELAISIGRLCTRFFLLRQTTFDLQKNHTKLATLHCFLRAQKRCFGKRRASLSVADNLGRSIHSESTGHLDSLQENGHNHVRLHSWLVLQRIKLVLDEPPHLTIALPTTYHQSGKYYSRNEKYIIYLKSICRGQIEKSTQFVEVPRMQESTKY